MPELFTDITALALLAFVIYLAWVALNKTMLALTHHLERNEQLLRECTIELLAIKESFDALTDAVQNVDSVSTLRGGGG